MKIIFTKTSHCLLTMAGLLLSSMGAMAQFGNALVFNQASSQYVTVPHSNSINLSATFTIEAAVNYSGSNATIVDKGNYDFLFQLNANGNNNKLGFYYAPSNTWVYSSGAVPQNTASHVAIVGNAAGITFYINGVASGSYSGIYPRQDNLAMNIGRQQPSACQCNHFNGTMDELRIWNIARTAAQIQSYANSTVPVNSPGLAAYYKFDESSGTTTADASGNGNTGTLVNGPYWKTSTMDYGNPGTFTYTVPQGVSSVLFQLWGAGANAAADCNGKSGGGAAYSQSKRLPVTVGQTYTCVVGAASGAAGVSGTESYVTLNNVKRIGAFGGAVGTGGAASTVSNSPDLDFSYKGGNAGNNVSYYTGNTIIFGGAGASAGPLGAGANGDNADAFLNNTNGGSGTPSGGGAGGNGAGVSNCTQAAYLNLNQNGQSLGAGGGGPFFFNQYGKGVGGLVRILPCLAAGTIGVSHTVPNPAELAADTIRSTDDGGDTRFTWQSSADGSTGWTTITGATAAYYPLPVSTTDKYYRRLTASCGEISNTVFVKVFSIANQKLNGKLEGKVVSVNGSGVDGIPMTGQKTVSLLGSPITKIYYDTTKNEGQFSFKNVFYGDAANGDPSTPPTQFRITATKAGHTFSPPVLASLAGTGNDYVVTGLKITDSTVYSLTGTVTQSCTSCVTGFTTGPIDSVKVGAGKGSPPITLGISYSNNTTGGYGVTLTDPGNYTLTPSRTGHTFSPAATVVNVTNGDVGNINFIDNTTRTVSGVLKAGCNETIGTALLEFTDTIAGTTNVYFKKQVTTAADGSYSVSLPAKRYRVRVLSFTPNAAGSDIPVNDLLTFFNTTIKDSLIANIDSTAAIVNLIYHRPPVLQIPNLPDTSFAPYALFRQGKAKSFIVNVYEGSLSHGCKVATDTARRIRLTTAIQSMDDQDEVILHGQVNGADTITLVGGSPNIVAPFYYKSFLLDYRDKYGRAAAQINRNIVVLGLKNDPGTFTTVSPQIPLMILHDPPGDQSYSYWESGQSNETAMRFYAGKTNANGGFVEVKLGAKFLTGFIAYFSEVSIWGTLNFNQMVSAKVNNATEAIVTTANTQRYSTSQNSPTIGNDGDVYIGSALNLLYARAHELKYVSNQTLGIEDKLAIAQDGFSTNFIYSEAQIVNNIIPTLQSFAANPTVDTAQRTRAANQVHVWQQVLANNAANKARAAFVKNVSFDGRVGPIDSSTTSTATKSSTIEFAMEIDRNMAVGLGFEIGGIGVSGGYNINMKMETGSSTTTTSTATTTIGYSLDDDDDDDYFSVDIKKDPVYNTPVFQLVAGTTSCPTERPGQSRDAVQLLIPQPVQTNIPANGEAFYDLHIGNVSESNETRSYNLNFDIGSANGATVTYNGNIPAGAGPIPVPDVLYGQERVVTVSVKKNAGSNVYTYEGLKFTATDACGSGVNVSSSKTISAYFASPCSGITLASPANNWVVSSANNNVLPVQISGYTIANLQSVSIEHTSPGSSSWITDTTLYQALITNPTSTTLNWNVASIADGGYDIRLKLVCSSGIVYSQRATGIIDRRAPIVFGIPEPTNNSYVAGSVISVTYNEIVNTASLGSSQVQLRKLSDGTLIPVQVSGYQNKIIITPTNAITGLTGENMQLVVVNVADLYGNVQSLGDTSVFVVGTTVAGTGPTAINLSSVKSSQLENAIDSMDIRFTVTQAANFDRQVNFTISGTATYGQDYTVRFPAGQSLASSFNGSQGSITILKNTTQVLLRIRPIRDNVKEPDETITISLAEGGNYVLGSVISKTDTIKNDDLTPPVIIANGPLNLCAGQTLTLSTSDMVDGQPVYSYNWSNGTINNGNQSFTVTQAGTYTLTVYTANGFSGVSTPINVTISSMAAPNLGPDVTVYKSCYGELTNLNSLFTTTGLSASWNTANTTTAPPGTYRLVATNTANCTDTAFAYVVLEVATWTGIASNDWHNPANWNIGKVPGTLTHVIVPGGTPNPCIISGGNAVAASIQVRNGGVVHTINNKVAEVNGKCLTLPPN